MNNTRRPVGIIILRVLLALLALFLLAFGLMVILFVNANRTNGEMISSGVKREYLLIVPESYDPATPTPLVISLHGFAEWPAHQAQISGWDHLAEQEGFIVVFPSGTGFPKRWSAHGQELDSHDPLIDVTFISDLIDKLELEYNIDQSRIFVNGLSNGGGMSYLLACALSESIAAFGGVAGAYMLPGDQCILSRPVPVIAFHGTADRIVPYNGTPTARYGLSLPAIPDWINEWVNRNECVDRPIDLPTSGMVTGVIYSSCKQNAEVIFYTIQDGGHTWPGGEALPEFLTGQTTKDIDATSVMWQFFKLHPLEKAQ